MKKKLNTESITNELEGASLFFKKSDVSPSLSEPENPIIEKGTNTLSDSPTSENNINKTPEVKIGVNQSQKRTNVLSYVRTDVRTNERTNERTVIKPKRQKIRHAFDIYEDQLISLQLRQLEAVQRGKRKPRLGKMVQEAIDNYLKQLENKRNRA